MNNNNKDNKSIALIGLGIRGAPWPEPTPNKDIKFTPGIEDWPIEPERAT